ncbi:hypothetical protein NEUTE2DRAFT_129568 [Neurospora tetrasperma FGSC 2509]|nr:hypothetical protein NEUTE2DRAFT_129568 [Neurospora tetrasperma FGSC 2509]
MTSRNELEVVGDFRSPDILKGVEEALRDVVVVVVVAASAVHRPVTGTVETVTYRIYRYRTAARAASYRTHQHRWWTRIRSTGASLPLFDD